MIAILNYLDICHMHDGAGSFIFTSEGRVQNRQFKLQRRDFDSNLRKNRLSDNKANSLKGLNTLLELSKYCWDSHF